METYDRTSNSGEEFEKIEDVEYDILPTIKDALNDCPITHKLGTVHLPRIHRIQCR